MASAEAAWLKHAGPLDVRRGELRPVNKHHLKTVRVRIIGVPREGGQVLDRQLPEVDAAVAEPLAQFEEADRPRSVPAAVQTGNGGFGQPITEFRRKLRQEPLVAVVIVNVRGQACFRVTNLVVSSGHAPGPFQRARVAGELRQKGGGQHQIRPGVNERQPFAGEGHRPA